jgi:electron transfer flavoprotein alpha subunit
MVLVFAESPRGKFNKAAFEAVTYGRKVADNLGTSCAALVLGQMDNAGLLGTYGASSVLHASHPEFNTIDSQVYAAAIADTLREINASVLILSHTSTGKSIAGRLSVKLNAGLVSGVNKIPSIEGNHFIAEKSVFSGKAVANYAIQSAIKIITLAGNAVKPEMIGEPVSPEAPNIKIIPGKVKVIETKTQEGTVPLPEAEIVVSAGRGLKDPSNWGIIEDLANTLGATTACSRPVADSHWRPHHEHVGQTGIAIRPNLYIAVGISGAIQHLAGVNNSKVIVVINKDPEAPFFKAADYGVVGDLFEVVPRLNESLRKLKAS